MALKKILRDLQPIFGAKSAAFIETRANKQKQRARNVPLASGGRLRDEPKMATIGLRKVKQEIPAPQIISFHRTPQREKRNHRTP